MHLFLLAAGALALERRYPDMSVRRLALSIMFIRSAGSLISRDPALIWNVRF